MLVVMVVLLLWRGGTIQGRRQFKGVEGKSREVKAMQGR
jgi:hypothetical protein